MAKQEANDAGCEEAILLDAQGFVSEGSSENVFAVTDGSLCTPGKETILEGITRDTVIRLASGM
ncbi:MAG TPA: aminotransferase class IV, partial [Candidatus Norongarragalinales archaeon]|nr:aminotransferase class IV [Candidatus Norongarragalinales archaeon]